MNRNVLVSNAVKKAFITVGVPTRVGPGVYEKVMVLLARTTIEEEVDKLRRAAAKELTAKGGKEVTPGSLYWMVYDHYSDQLPSAHSENAEHKLLSDRVKVKYNLGKFAKKEFEHV